MEIRSLLKAIMKKLFNFRPINKWPKNKKVFDIISFIIFCPKHNKMAATYVSEDDLAEGFPFVYIPSYIKIDDLIEDSLCFILSGDDSEVMAKYKDVLPFDTNVSHVLSLRLRQFEFGFTRFTCFVRLHSDNPVLKCCQTIQIYNEYLTWYNIDQDYFKYIEKYYLNVIRIEYEIIQDYLPDSVKYFLKNNQSNLDLAILKYLKITEKEIHLFFIGFIEYCFPSVYLTFCSFKHYLENLGLILPDYLMKTIFEINTRKLMYFEDLLIALICMDPLFPHIENRFRFIFHYYDCRRDGFLCEEEVKEMIRDIHINVSEEVIDGMVANYMALKNTSSEGLTYNDFEKGVISSTIEGTDRLLRLKFRLFRRIGCGRKSVGPNVLNDYSFSGHLT